MPDAIEISLFAAIAALIVIVIGGIASYFEKDQKKEPDKASAEDTALKSSGIDIRPDAGRTESPKEYERTASRL